MKYLLFCLLVGFGVFPALAESRAAIPYAIGPELTATDLTAGAYIITHTKPWPANGLVAVMADSSLVLVNTPYTPNATRELLRWMAERFGKHPTVAINTHFHPDCLGGNEALMEAGIPIYGCDRTPPLLAERGEAVRAQLLEWLGEDSAAPPFKTMSFFPPDHLFPADSGLVLEFGGERIELYYPGPAHSPDNIVVYFPAKRLLFGGCMILGMNRIGNTADADMAAWPASVERLRRFNFRYLIPGHGEVYAPDLLDITLRLLK